MQAASKHNEFFNTWTLYDQVLDHNYMFHEEIVPGCTYFYNAMLR